MSVELETSNFVFVLFVCLFKGFQAIPCQPNIFNHLCEQAMDFDAALVLHDGDVENGSQGCVKCFQRPPQVVMAALGKCFICHGTHCVAFGEMTWAATRLHLHA